MRNWNWLKAYNYSNYESIKRSTLQPIWRSETRPCWHALLLGLKAFKNMFGGAVAEDKHRSAETWRKTAANEGFCCWKVSILNQRRPSRVWSPVGQCGHSRRHTPTKWQASDNLAYLSCDSTKCLSMKGTFNSSWRYLVHVPCKVLRALAGTCSVEKS